MTYEDELKQIADETKKLMELADATIETVQGQLDGELTTSLKDIWIDRNEKIKAVKKKYGK